MKLRYFLLVLLILFSFDAVAKNIKKEKGKGKEKDTSKEMKIDKKDVERKKTLKDNVKKNGSEVYIRGIPMIDQGKEDTCAICTAKRQLCYYTDTSPKKCPISDKALKKELGYKDGMGTNPAIMSQALSKYASAMHLNYKLEYVADLGPIIKKYNSKCKEKNRIDDKPEVFTKKENFEKLDFNVWKKVANDKTQAEQKKVWKLIQENIDNGIPVTWCVILINDMKKLKKDDGAGHARMIIGYDPKRMRITYSDSWGAGHERKNMNWDEAWAITTEIEILKPAH